MARLRPLFLLPSATLARVRYLCLVLAVIAVLAAALVALVGNHASLPLRLVAVGMVVPLIAIWVLGYRRAGFWVVLEPFEALAVSLLAYVVPPEAALAPLLALLFRSLYGSLPLALARLTLYLVGLGFAAGTSGAANELIGRAFGLTAATLGMQFMLASLLRQEKEEEAFRLLEGAKDYAVFMLNAEGRVRSWNQAAERMLGLRDEEVLGRHLSELYPEEEADAAEDDLAGALREGSIEIEDRRLKRPGGHFLAEVVLTALRGEREPRSAFSVIVRDVSERREAVEALEQSQERLRTVVDGAPLVLWALDREGVVRLCQGGRLDALGIDPDMLVGRRFDRVGGIAQFVSDNRRALQGEARTSTVEFAGRVFETRLTPLRDDADQPAGVIGVATDVTAEQIADRLQRSLLPSGLPEIPDLALAARYYPGAAGSDVGGDWYDVVPLPNGDIGIAVGDVMGRGVEAATLMGQLRTAFVPTVLEHSRPSEVLERINELTPWFATGKIATAVYGVIDRFEETFRFASAGHLPPLLISADGQATLLDIGASLPLGALALTTYKERVTPLRAGQTLVLYTDGLVEKPGQSLRARLEQLRAAATMAPTEIEALLDFLVAHMNPEGGGRDDIAVLAVREVERPLTQLEFSIPATPDALFTMRVELGRWLRRLRADPRQADRIIVACGEACANAVEHAYGPEDAEVHIRGALVGDEVEVLVKDAGRWRPPRGRDRGRGLQLMKAMVKLIEITSDSTGTTVLLRQPICANGAASQPTDDGR